jgi:hypothetical protein
VKSVDYIMLTAFNKSQSAPRRWNAKPVALDSSVPGMCPKRYSHEGDGVIRPKQNPRLTVACCVMARVKMCGV